MFSFTTLAGRFPFRLGTTSYIVPADMETNVRCLGDEVDDVALLFLRNIVFSELDPSLVCVENLDYPFERVTPIAEALGMSLCLDIGHVLTGGYSLDEYLSLYLRHARVVHLHGVLNQRGHQAVSCLPAHTLQKRHSSFVRDSVSERVVTVQVFNENDLKDSVAMEALIQ